MTSKRTIVHLSEIQTVTFVCAKCRGRIAFPVNKTLTANQIKDCPVCNEEWKSPAAQGELDVTGQARRSPTCLQRLRPIKSPFQVVLEIDEPASEREHSAKQSQGH
jgi:hypothetical protein